MFCLKSWILQFYDWWKSFFFCVACKLSKLVFGTWPNKTKSEHKNYVFQLTTQNVTLAGDSILQVQWFLFYFTILFLYLDICQTLSQFVISHAKLLIVIKNEGKLSQLICLCKLLKKQNHFRFFFFKKKKKFIMITYHFLQAFGLPFDAKTIWFFVFFSQSKWCANQSTY